MIAPWVVGSDYVRLDPELRKSFEVALHVGTAAALAIVLHEEVIAAVREIDTRRMGVIVTSLTPPAIAALSFERVIERRLGRPEIVAAGLVAGSLAMWWADRRGGERERGDAGWRDGAALGVAQALALIPGVSRSGSTIVAMRARGFTPLAASELSMHAALPVIAGATILKGVRLYKRGLRAGDARGLRGRHRGRLRLVAGQRPADREQAARARTEEVRRLPAGAGRRGGGGRAAPLTSV